MAAISDELGVTHMTVYRWQKGMRKAENCLSVLHMLDNLMIKKKGAETKTGGSQKFDHGYLYEGWERGLVVPVLALG